MKSLFLLAVLPLVSSLSEPGVWKDVTLDKVNRYALFKKIMYKDTKISVQITCENPTPDVAISITVGWLLRYSPCASEYFIGEDTEDKRQESLQLYYTMPDHQLLQDLKYKKISYIKSNETDYKCDDHIVLPDETGAKHVDVEVIYPPTSNQTETSDKPKKEDKTDKPPAASKSKRAAEPNKNPDSGSESEKKKDAKSGGTLVKAVVKKTVDASGETGEQSKDAKEKSTRKEDATAANPTASAVGAPGDIDHSDVAKTWQDGNFGFFLYVDGENFEKDKDFQVKVTVRMHGKYGYISAHEWPLLIFYGVMGLLYLFLGITWLVMLACNWRDLLRVQFWVGGVIVLGMIEKAVFYAEYQSVANNGCSVQHGSVIFAEIVSSLKRALARMLVIIVSIGFGIVKPRLGPTLHKVLFVGALYFILGSIEGSMRALQPMGDHSTESMLAAVPLAVVDASICWWIFSCLIQTTRQLRLRRNIVKLTLYRHFTNTLIFAVLASVIFMIWSLIQVKTKTCLTDWQELWVDDAFWHLLFSVILIVIMILWRPSSNNQRYAFSPLLDADDDEEDDTVMNDAFDGMKMRSKAQANGSPKMKERNSIEDDLKWVEDNIPSSVTDKALPGLLDSDEEIMTAKYEMSKMQ